MIRGIHPALLVLAVCSALVPGGVAAQTADPTVDGPKLRVVLPSTVAPLADVYLDGLPLADLADMPSGAISRSVPVPAGTHHVDLFADGADPVRTPALATALVEFGDAGLRTVAVRGDASAMIIDDAASPPAAGASSAGASSAGASLRLVNLDTNAGSVDAWLGDRPIALGLSSAIPSSRLVVDAATATLTANAPGDRGSVLASEDVELPAGSATTAFMVPTGDRSVWLVAADGATPPVVAPSSTPTPGPSAGRTTSEWRRLPVYECELRIAFVTDGEATATRRSGSAEVRVPASLRDGLALYHYPVMQERGPLSGWALGPDGWSCVRHLAGDFDTSVSGLTIRSAGAGRAAAATCGAFGCDPAVGASTGRFIAYQSMLTGGGGPSGVAYGVPGVTACRYLRRFRTEEPRLCRGVRSRAGDRSVPRRARDGSSWVGFATERGGDTVRGAVGVGCTSDGCLPHLIECKLLSEDQALCASSLRVMLDARRVRVARVAATLACPGSVTLVRAGDAGQPPGDFSRARVLRTLRGEHDLLVDAVPIAAAFAGGAYPAVCGGAPDRLWYRVRRVDGDRVNGWIAAPLVAVPRT